MKTIPITLRRAVFFLGLAAIVCPLSGIGFQHFGGSPIAGVLAAAAFVWFLLLFMEVGFTELTWKQQGWWINNTMCWGCLSLIGSVIFVLLFGSLVLNIYVGLLAGIPVAMLYAFIWVKHEAKRYPSDDE